MSAAAPLAAPHAHEATSIARTMGWVMLALTPATLFGLVQFGWPAIFLFGVTILTAVVAEAVCLRLAGKPVRAHLLDGSAVLTGWLLALTLPPWAPWWIGVVGALIAIVIAKQIYGGIGQNLFNPAMVARVALLIAFPLEMTQFVPPLPLFSGSAPELMSGLAITFGTPPAPFDGLSGATVLDQVRTAIGQGASFPESLPGDYSPLAGGLGTVAGSMGETSALLLLAGGLLLLYVRVIRWPIPVAMLGSIALLAGLMHLLDPSRYADPLYHLVSGATLLGAFFIATDLVTSPVSQRAQLVYGALCGVLAYVIRTWTHYPEGVAFAVMLGNAAVPLLDQWLRPRIYGRDRRGRPLAAAPGEDGA